MNNRCKSLLLNLPPWILTGVTIVLILWLTLSPKPFGDVTPPLFPGADKLAHGLMFGILVVMMELDRWRQWKFKHLSIIFIISCGIISSLFGVLIEYLQAALPVGRSFEPMDMVADSLGACVAVLFSLIFRKEKTHE